MDEHKKSPIPMVIEVDEFKQSIVQLVNDAVRVRRIPYFILEPILSDITMQVREGAKEELRYAKQQTET